MKLPDLEFIKETEERQENLDFKKTEIAKELSSLTEEKSKMTKRLDHLTFNRFEPFDLAKERLIGNNNLMPINYLQVGFIVANAICRIHVKNINGGNEGYGTGFLISPNLVLTNNHVFSKIDDAKNSLLEFNYQYNSSGEPAKSYIFSLDVSKFFYTNEKLDFTIVYVNSISSTDNKSLSDFGFLKLFESPNKVLVSEYVSIIQHPAGQYKQIAIRENEVLSIEDNFITYSTDTAQGSSGSPVFNDQWQVVALHHSGVPRKDGHGNYLCKDGRIFQKGMDDSLIEWISNEGVRVSSILQDLRNNSEKIPSNYSNRLLNEIFVSNKTVITHNSDTEAHFSSNGNSSLNNGSRSNDELLNKKSTVKMENKLTLTIPFEISVGIGSNNYSFSHNGTENTTHDLPESKEQLFVVEKATNQNYNGRNGYEPNFVSTDTFKIDLAELLNSQSNKLAPLLNPTDDNKNLLKYFNFSVAIHKNRKLCLMTAVNIDGNRLDPENRENNKWIIDPRMDELFQTGPHVYASNDLDRGHMVRRLDPVWGQNASAANDDTFHFSNSTPQHKNLNQKTWLSLENYILDNCDQEKIKASVFTGPVFSDEDIPYRGTLLPLQFWKVAAMIKSDGTPSVTGYMLKQPDDIDKFRTLEGIREDGFGQFRTYQVPLQKIANLTGIPFDKYNEFDPLNGVDFNETAKLIEINTKADIKI